jgi:NADH-quinone oxidoreductase subunit C
MAADQQLVDELTKKFGNGIAGARLDVIDPWIEVGVDHLLPVALYVRDECSRRFDMLNCISGVDYFHVDPKLAAKAAWAPHLELVYHLSSTVTKQRLTLKVILPRWRDDVPGQLPEVPSLTAIWSTADWHEREVFDLTGVQFVGHPHLRRILCPEDWEGHPLRKDYTFPTFYHGIRNY